MNDMLSFDEASHTYRFSGRVVPGVTSVLKPLQDFSGIPPAVLAAKADLGRRVHFACQLHDEDDLDESSVQEDVAPYLAAYRRFLLESGAVILENERKVFERSLMYAGTIDRVLRINQEVMLVDLKTSISTPLSAGPQTAAYKRALNDVRVTSRAALRLKPDGSYRLDALNDANDFSVFIACLTLRNFLENNRDH